MVLHKKRPKSLLALAMVPALVISLFTSAASADKQQEAEPVAKNKLQAYVDDMQPGWNLGNSLDAVGADETAWGNPKITKELIEEIADQGYKSIRIPVTWDSHIGEAPNYTIEPAYLDRVEQVVDWALDEDLYVMVNVHHDSWLWISHMETKHDEVLARYNAIWTQVADHFKDHSNKLMFESVNEPRFSDGGTTDEEKMFDMLKELNLSFHSILRESGGKNTERPLVLSTLEASPTQERMDELYATITELNDPNIIATVHYYGFWPFSVNIAGYTHFEKDTKNDIIQTFDNVHNTFVAKGIPVILGEYGLLGFDQSTAVIEQGEKLKFFEFLTHYLNEKDVTHMLWDNGQHMNRTTYEWSDLDFFNIMKEGWKGRSATAETDLIFVEKGADVKDANIQLELNGNKLTKLSVDGKNLKKFKDYVVSDHVLTIKASKLEELTASGEYGVNSVITAEFNKGADWKFRVITNSTPVLQDAEGTTESFAIPVSFNGDLLATMEAKYTDGTVAGPQNWTSFKEFEYTFSPSYDKGEVVLKPNFFNETKDAEVVLTFHFWSGEVITYKITKNGTSVTGSAS
ncbi:cellulase family glycosylhydrolase [Paenibacillus shunpengii]|uniref:Cellulase family glycosylhydrolase n=1 Tax=Paenibacillus shunpengii TaxID=2054424 RepID=A0ABW5SIY1_9BACL|nr:MULTISPECIES: cellulase family glycosylhydrolase [unclassified Paenibacillus]OMC72038.1 cellulase [Paenibacillus sp. FSL H7-0326]SDX33749.1 Aryl-phospho-beta-D-glucosidase BglC, GH1 family [Paenibacillus sp. PDC88]